MPFRAFLTYYKSERPSLECKSLTPVFTHITNVNKPVSAPKCSKWNVKLTLFWLIVKSSTKEWKYAPLLFCGYPFVCLAQGNYSKKTKKKKKTCLISTAVSCTNLLNIFLIGHHNRKLKKIIVSFTRSATFMSFVAITPNGSDGSLEKLLNQNDWHHFLILCRN